MLYKNLMYRVMRKTRNAQQYVYIIKPQSYNVVEAEIQLRNI